MESIELRIKNKLDALDPNWVKIVYDKIGVLCDFNGYEFDFWSKCGFCTSYSLDNVDDESIFAMSQIESVDDFVNLIQSSEFYDKILSDYSIGNFTKSELFYSIVHNLCIPTNHASNDKYGDDAEHLSIFRVRVEGRDWWSRLGEHDLWFVIEFAFVERDESYIEIPISEEMTLDDAMSYIKNDLVDWINECDIRIDVKTTNDACAVPETYDELFSFKNEAISLK